MGPIVGWLVTIINRKFRRYSRRIQDSMGDVTSVAKETLEAPRVVKVYNAQEYKSTQFEAVNEHNRRSNMRLVLTKGLSNPVVQMVMSIGLGVCAVDRDLGRHQQSHVDGRSVGVSRGVGADRAAAAQPGRRRWTHPAGNRRRREHFPARSTNRLNRRAASLQGDARSRRHRIRRRRLLVSGRQGACVARCELHGGRR